MTNSNLMGCDCYVVLSKCSFKVNDRLHVGWSVMTISPSFLMWGRNSCIARTTVKMLCVWYTIIVWHHLKSLSNIRRFSMFDSHFFCCLIQTTYQLHASPPMSSPPFWSWSASSFGFVKIVLRHFLNLRSLPSTFNELDWNVFNLHSAPGNFWKVVDGLLINFAQARNLK